MRGETVRGMTGPPEQTPLNGGDSVNRPWWQQEAAIVLALVLVFPLGVFLMWLYAPWQKRSKWILTGVAALAAIVIFSIAFPETDGNSDLSPSNPTWENAPRSDFGFNYKIGYEVCGWDREQTFREAGTRNPEAAAKWYILGVTSDAAPGSYAGCLDALKGVRSRY